MLRRHVQSSSNVSTSVISNLNSAIISLSTSSSRFLWFAPKPSDHDNRLEKIAKTKWLWENVNGPLKPHRSYSYDPSSFNRKEAEKVEKAANVGPDQLPLLRRLDDEKMKELELAKNLSFFNNNKNNRNEANENSNNSLSSLSHWKAISSSLESRKTPFSPIENCLQKFPSEIRRQHLEEASQIDANIIPTAVASGIIPIYYQQEFDINNNNNSQNNNSNNNKISQDQLNYTKFTQDLQLLELLCGTAWDILRQLLSPSAVRMPKKWKEAAITDFRTFCAELDNEFAKVMLHKNSDDAVENDNLASSLVNILESSKNFVDASQVMRFQQDVLHLIGNVRMVLHYSDQLENNITQNDEGALVKNDVMQFVHETILKLCRDQDESGGQDLVRDEMIFEFFSGITRNNNNSIESNSIIKSFHQKFIASVMHTEKTLDPENLDIVSLFLQREFQLLHENQNQKNDNEEIDSTSVVLNNEEMRQNLASVMLAYAHSVQRFCRRVTKAHQEIQFSSKNRGFGRTPVDGTVLKGIVRTLSTALDSPVIQEFATITGSSRVDESFSSQSSLLSSIERIILSLSEIFAIVPNFELPTEALIQLGDNYGVFRQMLVMGRQINNSSNEGTQIEEQRSLYESASNTFFQLTTIPVYKNLMINVLVRDETNFHLLRSESILSLLNSVLSNPECVNLVKTNSANNEDDDHDDETSNQQLQQKQRRQRQQQIEKNATRELRTKYSLLVRSCLKQINGITFSSSSASTSVLPVIYALERIHSETFIDKLQSSVVKMDLATWRKLDTVLKEEIVQQRESDRDPKDENHFGSLPERAREILNVTIRKYCVFDPVTKKHVV